MKKIALLASLFLAARLFAQTEDITGSAPDLPLGYRTVTLGLGIEELTDALRQDTEAYLFREDRDVYFVPLRNENYVETTGRGFIKRAFFQLKDASVFVISLDLNSDRIDYYSVFTAFREKYGDPASLDPQKAMWESETVRVTIERPLTVKYIDRAVFDALLADAEAVNSNGTMIRERFLQDF
ncbi:MAG: hypothetical protein LBK61_09095 [Spirochaetaceae bacterium]|jgi:hypothetical protein|nr:hypothetical protein [Spirochaetaceae bacterium]